jgi:hypothetical protein
LEIVSSPSRAKSLLLVAMTALLVNVPHHPVPVRNYLYNSRPPLRLLPRFPLLFLTGMVLSPLN